MKYPYLGILLLAFSACKKDEAQFIGLEAAAHLENAVLDFGGVYLEAQKPLNFSLVNDGLIPIDLMRDASESSPFSISALPESLEANKSLDVLVVFEPTEAKEFRFNFQIQTDAGEFAVELMGIGLPWPECENLGPCQDAFFNPNAGECQSAFVEGSCDDESLCTQNDRCVEGQCVGKALLCDDGNACTQNLCNPDLGCVFDSPTDCNDENPCTEDSCDEASGGCSNSLLPEGSACDDGSVCTDGDQCLDGSCTGEALSCDDGITCTEDSCDPEMGCENLAQNTRCDDADPCTDDRCSTSTGCNNETVANYTPCGEVDCQEAPLCFFGECVSITPPDGTPCLDSNRCTQGDSCQAGECMPGVVVPLYTAISTGWGHTCALSYYGEVTCWGLDDFGQSHVPTGHFEAVGSGFRHSCALRAEGGVECWGQNSYGQSEPPPGAFKTVSAGVAHSCGLRLGGEVECWGRNDYGESEPPPGNFKTVSAGEHHSCGLRTDGEIDCWGGNDYGESDPPSGIFATVNAGYARSCGLRSGGEIECWGLNNTSQNDAPSGVFAAVDAGAWHTCALHPSGEVECWGDDSVGQSSPPPGSFTALSLGPYQSCGLRPSGEVECWGGNLVEQVAPSSGESVVAYLHNQELRCFLESGGQLLCHPHGFLGEETADVAFEPGPYASMSLGNKFVCGLSQSGEVACYGGEGATVAGMPALSDFDVLSAGGSHVCGLRNNGEVACWGEDTEGQSSPPPGLWSSISSGRIHTCGLRATGEAECWGSDVQGQSSPPSVPFTSMSSGSQHSCGLRQDEEIECWGSNSSGESSPPPGPFVAVSAASNRTCGIRPDHRVACWGFTPPESTYADIRLQSLDAQSTGPFDICGRTLNDQLWCLGYRWPAPNPLICAGPEEFVF